MGWLTAGLDPPPVRGEQRVIDENNDPLAAPSRPAQRSPVFVRGPPRVAPAPSSARSPPPQGGRDEHERFKAEVEAEIAARTARERAAAAALTAEVAREARAAREATTAPKTMRALLQSVDLLEYGPCLGGFSLVVLLRAATARRGDAPANGDAPPLDAMLREAGVVRVGHRLKIANALRAAQPS